MTLPQYQSHKIVGAAKILGIADNTEDFGYVLDLQGAPKVTVSTDWLSKRGNATHDSKNAVVGGYFIEYPDGYTSWSPAAAFEEGYRPAVVLTEGDATADLAGTPRPDNPGRSGFFMQPKIVGYRQLSEQDTVLMNSIKELGPLISAQVDSVQHHVRTQFDAVQFRPGEDGTDARTPEQKTEFERLIRAEPNRWISIANTHFQQAMMALTRAVAQPDSY